ncbi:hypothetical protein [Nocardia jejuensis]|uniref:hypothetical protein n=1 Tax=Nocardia jejuensis TaxID=328049 RepID=UPI001FDECA38|nr:hypothetical protein [Nocardia jejuensis]
MIGQRVRVSDAVATDAMWPYLCLIELVGTDGVIMLGAEALPPDKSRSLLNELKLETFWSSADGEPFPVTELRCTAEKLGILERVGDRLMLSESGFRMLVEPEALWWYIAEWVPESAPSALVERDAAVLFMLASATDTGDAAETAAPYFDALGHYPDGRMISTGRDVMYWIPDLIRVLRCLRMAPSNTVASGERRHPATQLFARAVLERWTPGDSDAFPSAVEGGKA